MIWGLSLEGWEDLMRTSLAVVGVFGLIVGLATWFVAKLQRSEIVASKEEFERYKIEAGKEIASTRVDADAKIDIARQEAKVAVERAQADIAIANARAAEAGQKAAEAALELTKLKTPRVLTADQHEKMKACLTGGPTGKMFIRPSMLDSDGPSFAKQLEEVFKEAGFEIAPWPGGPALAWSRAGIFLIVQRFENVAPHIAAVQRCLFAAGIEAIGEMDPKHPEDAVSIGIGPRL